MSVENEVDQIRQWMNSKRFAGITRLYSPYQVWQQRGTIPHDYTIAREAADSFYTLLRELYAQRSAITTYGPYSPGQAVAMKRAGIKGIYLGGWATSAKGSTTEDPGADLASYPLSQVPDEAAVIVRALLTADKNQRYTRSRMSAEELARTPEVDFRPFLICDADTGHGGDAHVRNLVRRFVEVGVPGYHIEDQRPGTKKCGHQGGKVLVPSDEQLKRLNAARLQLDIMGVAGLIVARTDAEAASLLDGRADERDQPFILGSTHVNGPSYKAAYLSLMKRFHDGGAKDLNGHLLYRLGESQVAEANAWLDKVGIGAEADKALKAYAATKPLDAGKIFDDVANKLVDAWQNEAGLMTYREAVKEQMEFRINEGEQFNLTVEGWMALAQRASHSELKDKARELGLHVIWDCEHAKTPEGYYQVRGDIDYAIAKSLAAAPFCDLLWMETKTADLHEAKVFAEAIHAEFPDKMLAYNLSPSFSWDTTGMSEDEMRRFPQELAKLGYVFNFITYGGHQIDGNAAEEFSLALLQEGMVALAQLQRKFRLVESPYRTPQTLVGGPRLDGALTASSGRTATTKAMGKGSTQFQHLLQTEVPPKLAEEWLGIWSEHNKERKLRVTLRPHRPGSSLLELAVTDTNDAKMASIVFDSIKDRNGRTILSIRDQNTLDKGLRRKRLMLLLHLFLLHRYKVHSVHYVSPTDDNRAQTDSMKNLEIYSAVADDIGQIIVADVNTARIAQLLEPDRAALKALITKA